MQRILPLVLLALALGCAPAEAGSGWLSNLEKGKKAAKKSKLPLLVFFTGSDWCKNCKALEKEVLESKEFKKERGKRFVLVKLDYPVKKRQDASVKQRNAKIKSDYSIEGFPTVLLVDFEGQEIGRATGYQAGNQKAWREQLAAVLLNFDPETGKARGKPAAGLEPWPTDHAAVAARARAKGRPMIVFFTGSDWCGWCARLKKEIFQTPTFAAWAKGKVEVLELDFPSRAPQSKALKEQNKKLAARYSVEGFPTVLILDSEGKVLGSTAYVAGGPKAWIAEAERALAKR